jgi:WD40 repeat protein
VFLWDAKGTKVDGRAAGAPVGAVAYSPDGAAMAVGTGDGAVLLWDAETRKELQRFAGHRAGVTSLAFRPDGKALFSGSQDHTLRLWDLEKKKEARQFGRLAGPVVALAVAGDGKTVACAVGDNTVRLFDVTGGEELRNFDVQPGVTALALSPDGRTVVTGGRDRTARLWEAATGRERRQVKGHGGWVEAVAVSPDGKVLATGSGDGVVRLWDTLSGKPLAEFNGHRGAMKALTFAPKGDLLASGGADTTAVLWDVAAQVRDRKPNAEPLKPAQLDGLWDDLASEDADRAYRAINALVLSGDQAAALLRKNLSPVQGDGVTTLIARLDDDEFAAREKARAELARLGKFAEAALRKALAANPSAEAQKQLEELLKGIADHRFVPERARGLRAVEVLEAVGSAEAKAVLQGLADGVAEAELTVEAKAALARLGK